MRDTATSVRDGLVSAVRLGGDTDTVAALVGGLMGGNLTAEQVRGRAAMASALATTRTIQSM